MRLASLSCACLLVLAGGCGLDSENADDDGETAGTSGTVAGQAGSSAGSSAGGSSSGTGGTSGTSAAGAGSGGLAAGAGGNATGGRAGSGSSGQAGGGAGGTLAGMSGSSGRGGASGGGDAGSAGSSGTFGGAGNGGSATGGAGQGGGPGAGSGGKGGKAGSGGSGGGGNDECPGDGNITYTLSRAANPSSDEQDAYDRITEAMDEALDYYNCYTNIERALSISYVPSVQTADGNPNGSIRFGSDRAYMNYITAMHETSHVLGVGSNEWDAMIEDGRFTGSVATAEMQEVTGDPEEYVHGDNQHFWPYGLNYTSEVTGESDLLNHMRIVVAIRVDLGFDDP